MKHALFVGNHRHRLYRPAIEWLSERYELVCVDTPRAACGACQRQPPELIVVGQVRPGQISSAEVEQIHREAPLARLVALLGEWCEGETRTGAPWPGVPRVYWHQSLGRLVSDAALRPGAQSPLPRTSTESERLMWFAESVEPCGGLVVVRSEDQLSFEGICQLLVRADSRWSV